MSLATQCPTCGTAFRVVQDQLKVSSGWVRCGQCDAVFNALEGLFDLRDDSVAVAVEPADASSFGDTQADAVSAEREGTPSSLAELLADPIDAHLFGPRKRAEVPRKPADYVGARDRIDFSDARFDSDLFADQGAADADADAGVEPPEPDASADELESATRPGFLRSAERRARWRSRPARLALSAATLLSAVALVGQAVHHYRDAIASDWPQLRAPLVAWCQVAGCTVQSARRIDDLRVESATLTRASGPEAYLLNVALRSRSKVALTMPWVELSLTDGAGRLVTRRALGPGDFRATDTIAPGAELSLQTLLSTGSVRVAGYTVEIFYP